MISHENFGWICPDDFVQIYAPDFGLKVERWLQRFFQDLAFFAFFPLAGGPLDPLLFGDIFSVPNGVLLAVISADKHHNNRPALANNSGRYKKSWHTACTKQPSVE